MFNNIKNVIQKNINKLPGIRHPSHNSLLNTFLKDYNWAFQKTNKDNGDIQAYYMALNNPYVARCNQVYIDESLSNGWRINTRDETPITPYTNNYIKNLFQNPQGLSDSYTFSMLNNQIWTSLNITGDVFIEVNLDETFNNIPIGFKYIPTEMIGFFNDTEQWGLRDTKYRYENDEIIHIYNPGISKRNYQWGTSIIDTIGASIAVEFLGMKHNNELLKDNGLDPKGILSFDKDLDEERVLAEIHRLANTKNKKGTLAVQGATYAGMSTNNRDMDFISLMNYSRDRIITAFGVQPSKIGVRENASLGSGTGESQDKDFQKTLNGKFKLIEDQFNKILGRHGFNEIFEYIREDNENKKTRAEIENIRLNNASATINEVRANYGEKPVEWGDKPILTRQSPNINSQEEINELGLQKSLQGYKNLSPEQNQLEIYKNHLAYYGLLKR